MDNTRLTLIQRISDDERGAWEEFDSIYRPLIRGWLGRYRLQANDIDDVTQDVLAVLVGRIGEFEHNGRTGAFRNWLRTTTVNLLRNSLRKQTPVVLGNSEVQHALAQLEDPGSDLSRRFDQEHNLHLVAFLLREIESDCEPQTLDVFRMHVVNGASVAETADTLSVSRATVHTAKSRVLRRLRDRAGDMLDGMIE